MATNAPDSTKRCAPEGFAYRRTVLILAIMLGCGAGALGWRVFRLQSHRAETMALDHAELHSRALEEFRTLYASEVAAGVRKQGDEVTHDYGAQEGALPLPITLSMILGDRMGESGDGGASGLYNADPFPRRFESGGPRDEFDAEAWKFLSADRGASLYRFEDVGGRLSMPYTAADLIRASCVDCHNSDPDSPRNDGREGGLTGVLEVVRPLEAAADQAKTDPGRFLGLIGTLVLFGVVALAMVLRKFRSVSVDLERRVQVRIAELEHAKTAAIRNAVKATQARAKAEKAESQAKNVLDAAPEGMIEIDARGAILSFNRAAEEMFGYRAKDIIGEKVNRLMPRPYAEKHDGYLAAYARTRKKKISGAIRELTGLRKDGTCFPIELGVSAVETGPETIFLGTVRDITVRKKSLEQLARLATAIEQCPDAIVVTDAHGVIEYVNPACEEISGYPRDEILGKPSRVFSSGKHAPAFYKKLWETLISGAVWKGRLINKKKDGTLYEEEATIAPVKNGEGRTISYVAVKRDVSKELALAAQLHQAQKLESIGQLAAGIAHEINTPTQFVGDNTRFLQEAFGDLEPVFQVYGELIAAARQAGVPADLIARAEEVAEQADLDYLSEEVPKAIQQSLEGIERVSKIVRSMKQFSHPGAEEKTPTDLNEAIASTVTVSTNEWKYVAEVRTQFDTDLPPVPCLPGDFNQVILNMIVNAAHAIADVVGDGSGEKGTITISTRRDGDWAEIRVADTGTGIPEKIRSKIFDPFFTTKEVGKGTGQGLAISHSVIVDRHGGTMRVESEVGKGAVFIVRLPLESAGASRETAGLAAD